MTAVFAVLTVLIVVAIALVSVGRVTFSLAAQPPPTFFDLDEAVVFVADRLPDEVTAQLSYDDVRQLIDWHIEYLLTKGVASTREGDLIVLSAEGAPPVIAADDEGVAWVLGRIAEQARHRADSPDQAGEEAGGSGLADIDDLAVVEVLEAEAAYLRAIGAVGSVVPGPLDPSEPDGIGNAGERRPES